MNSSSNKLEFPPSFLNTPKRMASARSQVSNKEEFKDHEEDDEASLTFANANGLPERESPMRYGMFDGHFSETREERALKLMQRLQARPVETLSYSPTKPQHKKKSSLPRAHLVKSLGIFEAKSSSGADSPLRRALAAKKARKVPKGFENFLSEQPPPPRAVNRRPHSSAHLRRTFHLVDPLSSPASPSSQLYEARRKVNPGLLPTTEQRLGLHKLPDVAVQAIALQFKRRQVQTPLSPIQQRTKHQLIDIIQNSHEKPQPIPVHKRSASSFSSLIISREGKKQFATMKMLAEQCGVDTAPLIRRALKEEESEMKRLLRFKNQIIISIDRTKPGVARILDVIRNISI